MNIFLSLLLALAQLFINPLSTESKSSKETQKILQFDESLPPFSNCPASPYPTLIVQPDNSTINIVGRGNMVNNWTETIDGYTVVLNSSGIYEYASNQNGKLIPTGVKANDPANRTTNELAFVSTLQPSVKPALSPLKRSILSQIQNQNLQKTFPTTGNIRILALLIDYSDLQNTFGKSSFDSLLYADNYRSGDGSFKYYYETASDSQITVTVDVFGWYRATNGYLYYGRDSGYARAADLAREAVDAAEVGGVNFANYDNDNDGDVDGILVVHSGPGAEQGSRTQYIWSHRWVLNGGNLGGVTYDGKFINDYMMNPETRIQGLNQNLVGIGVFAHEFGHNLGLPDLYDTDNTNGDSEGIGNWCLMAGGTWLGGEHRPSNFSAWCRIENNWATPTTLTIGSSNGSYTLHPSVDSTNHIYRVNTPLNNEYFLLENRQKRGLDIELPGEGLAVWHINTNKTNSFGNQVNADENLKGVDLEEADGNNDLDNEVNRGDAGDLFPGTSNNQTFDNSSNPNSKNYLNGNTNLELRNITENGTLVSFDFGPAPAATCAGNTNQTANSGSFDDGSGTSSNYANNLNCSWLISVANGPINLNFNAFDLDSGGDTLYVYDGNSNTDPLLQKLTGNAIPAAIASTGNDLLLEFITDANLTAQGWSAAYTSAGPPAATCSGTTTLPAAVSGILDDGSGVGTNYSDNLNCSWLIDATTAGPVLSINIDSLDIEATNDSLIIYAGQDNLAPVAAIITDNSQASRFILNSRFAFIEFKTNGSVNAKGWQLSWNGLNGCAGADTLTTQTGTFTDGTAPAVFYANRSNCEWLIQPNGASIIQLDFSRFDTEDGFDFVEVYDGPTVASTRIARLSGNRIPPTIYSTGGSMLVRFTSDFTITRLGFEANYQAFSNHCVPLRTFTTTNGSFDDGSGPNNYDPNLNCAWLIAPNNANNITLSFSAFDTESSNDVVNVYDGSDNTGTLLGSFSGNTIPSNVVLNGSNLNMFVEFITDGTTNAAGWSASYTSTRAATCSGTTNLTAASGSFNDGSNASNYDNNLNCSWLIQPPGNPNVINLDFSFLNVAFGDFVRIYDGTDNTGTLLGQRTGTFAGGTLTAFSGAMFVEFITNGSITAPGWTANYSSSSTFCVPNTTFTGNFGNFTDGSPFNGNYANNSDCEWLIQPAAPNVAVRLQFNRFSTEATNDTVTIYDGATTSDPILGTFSGSNLPPVQLSSGGSMLLTFKTNGSVTNTGWQAFYQTQPIPACAGTTNLTSATGSFDDGSAATSNYVANSNCSWLIQPTGASRVSLSFSRFAMGTGDQVTVYDGSSASDPILGSYTGNTIPPLLVSSGNSLFINFTANGFVEANGFAATYNSTMDQCFSNLILTNFRDTIEDGSGSSNYTNNLNCTWLIQPPTATSIDLNFVQFDLNTGDSLKIYDGTSAASPLLVALGGTTLPSQVSSTGGDMFVEFITDGSGTAQGWKGFYDINSTQSCVGLTVLNSPSGSFDDGSGTGAYSNNLNCGWLIQPNNNPAVINLTFNSMSTVNFNDRVFIYDGTNNSGQFLGSLFGTNTGNGFTAFSGSMFVEFITDGFSAGQGWDASYTTSNSFCVPNTTLTNNFGQISDGSPFTQNYLDNTSCQWLIQPALPNSFITLNFFQFDTEAGNDTVNIYDGSTTSDPLLASYSGNTVPPAVLSTGSTMLVTFNSNGSVTGQGWRGSYNAQPLPSCLGQTTLTAASGTFDDGSGPTANYDNNLNCSWLIQPPGALSVDLSFISFNTQNGADILRVYEGNDNTGTLLGSFSGNTLPGNLSSSNGAMFLEFTTDFFTNGPGWEVSYTSSNVQVLDAVEDTIFINAALGSQNSFTLNSNINWTVSENELWLLMNPISGSGNRSVNAVAVQPNIGPPRYAQVIISGNALSDTVIVAQRGSGRFLVTAPDTLFFQSTPLGSQMVNITSNVNWNLNTASAWINIGTNSGTNNGSSMISVNTNNSNQIRTGFIVASGNLGASNDTIWVVQDSMPAAPPSLTVIPGNLTLAMPANSNAMFTVNSTVSWQTSTPASWLSLQDPQVTMDTNMVGVTAISMNMTGSDRSSYVAVQDVGGTLFDTVFVTQTGGPLTLDATPDTLFIGSAASSNGVIAINSNVNWQSSVGNITAFTLNPGNGSGNGSILVTALNERIVASPLISFVAIDGANGALTDTVVIVQNGPIPTLSADKKFLNLPQTALGRDSTNINSNTFWWIENFLLPQPQWYGLTLFTPNNPAIKSEKFLVLSLTANNNANSRSDTLYLRDSTNQVRDTLYITQAGTNPVLQVNQDTVLLASTVGSTTNVSFLSNGNWTAVEGDPWFSSSATSGNGPANLTLTANSTNSTSAQRISFLALEDIANGLNDTVIVIQDTAQVGVQASPDTIFLSHIQGASGMINLSSSVSWNAVADAGWIAVNPSSGSGNEMISVTALNENPSFVNREGKVAITDINDPNTTDTVVIVQAGTPIRLTVTPDQLFLNSTLGSSGNLNVSSNTSWTVTNPASWLSLSTINGNNNGVITVSTTADNLTGSNRVANLTFSSPGVSPVQVTVTQIDGTTPQFVFSVDTVFVDFVQGSTGSFSIFSNQTNWSLSENTPWLLVNPMQGSGTASINVLAASRNAFGNERTAMIVGQSAGFPDDTVIVVQRASTALFQAAPTALNLGSDSANTVNFNISSNLISWTIEENENWMQVMPDSGSFTQNIMVMATETNRSGAIRNGSLTILSPPQVPITVNVTQDTVRTIGLNEVENEFGISIYPNPARDKVIIQGEGVAQLEIDGLRLFNSTGQEVQVNYIQRTPTTIEMDLTSQAEGIYYLNYSRNDKGISRKLILMK